MINAKGSHVPRSSQQNEMSDACSLTLLLTFLLFPLVCSLNGTNFQCRCEQQYVWSYDNCLTYGACDDIIGGTCGCINSLPTNGQYCQPQTGDSFTYQLNLDVLGRVFLRKDYGHKQMGQYIFMYCNRIIFLCRLAIILGLISFQQLLFADCIYWLNVKTGHLEKS